MHNYKKIAKWKFWHNSLLEKLSVIKELGVPLSGRAFRSNLLFVPHKRISTAIPNAKLSA
jgi:hypothetical protein